MRVERAVANHSDPRGPNWLCLSPPAPITIAVGSEGAQGLPGATASVAGAEASAADIVLSKPTA
jgi:hypothetical protein